MTARTWIDLAACDPQPDDIRADYCVIGAGAAGIYLTAQLAKLGRRVVLLEAGSRQCTDASGIGFDPQFDGNIYAGAVVGRFFGVGGSTSKWGGMLVPHTAHDLTMHPEDAVWQLIVDTVARKAVDVLKTLQYRRGWDFDSFADYALGEVAESLHDCGIDSQAALALPFSLKNLDTLLDRAAASATAPVVVVNAVAKTWLIDAASNQGARIKGIGAVSRSQKTVRVLADKFIIAAGALESARILLELNEAGGQPVLRRTSATGCYLGDHLSVSIADVEPSDVGRASEIFAPRFNGAWMRRFRLLEGSRPAGTPRAFAHFIFADASLGFELAKEVLCSWQERRMPRVKASAMRGVADLAQLAYRRYFHSALHIPKATPAQLQLDIEQSPVRDNQVTLACQLDEYGRRKARIKWQVSSKDMTNISNTATRLLTKWPGSSAGLPALRARAIGLAESKPYDAFHPVGTCRMGDDAEAVVDEDLKVWGVSNLWVASTGVFPSAGTANPTFSMLCLAEKLVEHLHRAPL